MDPTTLTPARTSAPTAAPLGESVLIAVDASPSCLDAAEVAGDLAARSGGRVAVVADPSHRPETRRVLADVVRRVREITGDDPVVLDENGPADRAVAAAASAVDATLVVTGSRGRLPGESVSLRIAAAVPCSVLVVRPRRSPAV